MLNGFRKKACFRHVFLLKNTAACSSGDDGGISVSGRTLEPYLPDEFSSKKVDALYGGTFTIQTYEFTKR